MKFHLPLLALNFIMAVKALPEFLDSSRNCDADTILTAADCINNDNGKFFYSFPKTTGCDMEYICMIPCPDTIQKPTTTKTLRFNASGQNFCSIKSNLDACQTETKYFDYKQCLILTMNMEKLEEMPSSYTKYVKTTTTTTTVARPTVVIKKAPVANKPVQFRTASKCGSAGEQCGGKLFTGSTCCESGLTCRKRSIYYSVCM